MPFAKALDPDVKMFFKIPSKFQIETPIGTYNPDWAVYLDRNGTERLYFVLETKVELPRWGKRTRLDDLRGSEQDKIKCGERHFAALDNDRSPADSVVFSGKPVKEWKEVKTTI